MNNTGSPRGGSHELPLVFIGAKTRTIGRIPSETAVNAKMPLMGSLSRRANGSNNGHPAGQPGSTNKAPSQPHPPPQTSFRQSDPAPPQTQKGGGNGGNGGNGGGNGGSKPTTQPAHQTSFPQSEPPEQAPTRNGGNGGPPKTDGPPPPHQSSPAAKSPPPVSNTPTSSPPESTSEAGHSRGPKKSNVPGAGGPPAVATTTVESFSSAFSGVITQQPQSTGTSPTHGSHNTDNPQSQSFTDNQHAHGNPKTDFSKSETHTLSSTQSFHDTFSSQSVSITSSSNTISSVAHGSKPAPTEPAIGNGPGPEKVGGNGNGNGKGKGNGNGKGSQPPQNHSKTTTASLSSVTKNGHTESPPSTTLPDSLKPPPPQSKTNNSHPTHTAGPNPKKSSSTNKVLSPLTGIPLPIHLSTAPAVPSTTHVDVPPAEHTPPGQTNKHHTAAPPGPPAAPPSHTTAQVTSRPLVPLPIHITKAQPAPSPVVTTAPNPVQRPPETVPGRIVSTLQPLRPTSEQGIPPVNTIRPTAVLPINSPSPIDASTPNTETVIPSPVFSSGKGGLVKELLNPDATIASVPAPFSTGGGIVAHSSASGRPLFVGTSTAVATDPSATTNSTWMGHHSDRPDPNESTSSSASNHSASIIGGVLGAIIALLVIALAVVGFCFYRKKLRKLQKRLQVYEKDGDVAPPLYAPHGVYDPRKAYSGQQYIPGNQEPTPPIPIIVHNPYPDATPGEHQTNMASRDFEGQMLTVPSYTKSMNPFVNMASMYPNQTNDGNHDQSPAVETDEKLVQQSNDIGSQYPAEKVNPPWATFNGNPPRKTRDAHLSKMSTATTLSSTSTYINDPDESFANVEFDSLKMVKARNAAVVGIAM